METSHRNQHHDIILHTAGLTAAIVLAEPTIFLSGFSKLEQQESTPALVRGSLILRVKKPKKLKSITLNFNGISRTEWPEGIPSEKNETHETKDVFKHEWRLFSVQQKTAATSSGAHSVISLDAEHPLDPTNAKSHHPDHLGHASSTTSSSSHTLVNQQEAVSKGYRVFNPAEYVYNFELMLPHTLPETMKCNFGTIRWGFNLEIDRQGKFKPKLNAYKEITLLRALGPSNLESSEPIVINRDWEDLLHYEIIIAGKAFAIGQKFNMGIALVRMSKVKCHRIRLYITEHTEYFCRNNRIHRVEPSHKFLLMEHKSPDGSRGDLLQTQGNDVSGLTEFEFDVEIPTHFPSRRDYLRPNASTESIKVYHWIKVVMRLSRQDVNSPTENKCYEVSIDSPITLVDAQTLLSSELPNYNAVQRRKSSMVEALKPYQKFIQDRPSEGSTIPPTQRAILFTRKPSIAPPPFDADVRPPTLPPPQYDTELTQTYRARYEDYLRAKSPGLDTDLDSSVPPPLIPSGVENSYHEYLHQKTENYGDSESGSQNSDQGSNSTAETQPEEYSSTNEAPNNQFSVFSEILWKEGDDVDDNTTNGNHLDVPATQSESQQKHMEDFEVDPQDMKHTQTKTSDPTDEIYAPIRQNPSRLSAQLQGVNRAEVESKGEVSPPLMGSRFNFAETERSTPISNPTSPDITDGSEGSPGHAPRSQESDSPTSGVVSQAISVPPSLSVFTDGRASPKTNMRNAALPQRNSIQLQRLRNSIGSAGSAYGSPGAIPSSVGNLSARHNPAISGRKLSLKTSQTPLSAGLSPRSPASAWSENASQLFGERWLDRRDSFNSITSSNPRYFRQGSVVSMDLTRQAEAGARDSRRPSRVSEIEEPREWYPLSRNNSDTSVAISVAEYQLADRQSSPLLRDDESEIDIGLEWENDFEDYSMLENDRRSVVSAFYTVMTP